MTCGIREQTIRPQESKQQSLFLFTPWATVTASIATMADCGASGSALDRTARAILSTNEGGAKQVASVVSRALGVPNAGVRPLATPDHIILPSAAQPPHAAASAAPQSRMPLQQQQQVPLQHHQWMPPQHALPTITTAPMMHQHPHTLQMAATAQQQQQQQQLMLMQHQQQQMQLMIQQQQLQQQQSTANSQEAWHPEGLEQNFQEELRRHLESLRDDDDVVTTVGGHEGIVQGATIEELAAAWARAEEEYAATNNNNMDQDVTTNLWTGPEEEEPGNTYEFINKLNNEYDESSMPKATDWMQEGLREFQAGNLPPAIRAFEMELQQNNADNATAWRMLGRCHAENDMDQQAIVCLEQAVDRDPYSPEALLALGVSYVNELNHTRALENLKAWITHNPTFAGLELDDVDLYGDAVAEATTASTFDDVQRLLLRALEFAPPESAADVLEALGVVYNVSRDYDAAIDAFHRAIDIRADDYQLWNKLGATLANSQKSDQALPAYNKALELKPKYARAWLNMAISHSNLQNYNEAARCYLQTLSLNPSALHCWSYLRIALSCSEQWDLIPLVAAQDLKGFQEHFDFLLY